MNHEFFSLPTRIMVVLFAIWFLYLLSKVAEHVAAWPFG